MPRGVLSQLGIRLRAEAEEAWRPSAGSYDKSSRSAPRIPTARSLQSISREVYMLFLNALASGLSPTSGPPHADTPTQRLLPASHSRIPLSDASMARRVKPTGPRAPNDSLAKLLALLARSGTVKVMGARAMDLSRNHLRSKRLGVWIYCTASARHLIRINLSSNMLLSNGTARQLVSLLPACSRLPAEALD